MADTNRPEPGPDNPIALASMAPRAWDEMWIQIRDGHADEQGERSCVERCNRLSRDLDGNAEGLALAAGYFGGRDMGMDHAHAVKRAHKAVAAVRKALGYSYPDRYAFDF